MEKVFGVLLMLAGGVISTKVMQALVALAEFNRFKFSGFATSARDQLYSEVLLWSIAAIVLLGLGIYLLYKKDSEIKSTIKIDENSEYIKLTDLDINSDATKIFLVDKYKIQKNDVLEGYTLNGKIYSKLLDALEVALNIELSKNNNLTIKSVDEGLKNEGDKIVEELKIYGYLAAGFNANKMTWNLRGSNSEFECTIQGLRELKGQFKK